MELTCHRITLYNIIFLSDLEKKNNLKLKIGTPCMFFILSIMFYIYELMTKVNIIPSHQMVNTPYEQSLT